VFGGDLRLQRGHMDKWLRGEGEHIGCRTVGVDELSVSLAVSWPGWVMALFLVGLVDNKVVSSAAMVRGRSFRVGECNRSRSNAASAVRP